MTVHSVLIMLALWLALGGLTTVVLALIMRRDGRASRDGLEAELRQLLDEDDRV